VVRFNPAEIAAWFDLAGRTQWARAWSRGNNPSLEATASLSDTKRATAGPGYPERRE
jgi:hypothetical protein